jgi:hypothetical protein
MKERKNKALVSRVELLFRHLPGETEENYEMPLRLTCA